MISVREPFAMPLFSSAVKLPPRYYAGTCGLCLRLFRIKSYLILFTTQQPDDEVETLLLAGGVDAEKW